MPYIFLIDYIQIWIFGKQLLCGPVKKLYIYIFEHWKSIKNEVQHYDACSSDSMVYTEGYFFINLRWRISRNRSGGRIFYYNTNDSQVQFGLKERPQDYCSNFDSNLSINSHSPKC